MPPPPGGATTSPDFFIWLSWPRIVQTTHARWCFFHFRRQSPSYASNLVGRWLIPHETFSQHPSRMRPRIGLLSLAAPTNRAQVKLHRWFCRFFHDKLLNTPASSTAPTIAIPSSPSPGVRCASKLHTTCVRAWILKVGRDTSLLSWLGTHMRSNSILDLLDYIILLFF